MQRSGQVVVWSVHHEVLMLRDTELGSMVWEPTRLATARSEKAPIERMVYGQWERIILMD